MDVNEVKETIIGLWIYHKNECRDIECKWKDERIIIELLNELKIPLDQNEIEEL